jgi:integrase
VVHLGGRPAYPALIAEFVRRYNSHKTRREYTTDLTSLFETSHRHHPRQLTESDVLAWASGNGRQLANNSIRSRLSTACVFVRWCVRTGEGDPSLMAALMDRDNPLLRIPRLYGKVQGKYPARWLTHDEAYGRLVTACDDGTELGLRDELVLRLGLGGMRAAEITALTVDDLRLTATLPEIAWIGKGNRPRRLVPGKQLLVLLDDYLGRYERAIGRPLAGADPVVCRQKPGSGGAFVSWGNPVKQPCSIYRVVRLRAEAAGLGHVTPHDLRRTAAGILHRTRDDGGAHYFDLLDIQKVLGHANPATTMRSYLDPLDTGVIERAAHFLD